MNFTNYRCQPFPGYFDPGTAVAQICTVGCLNCTSLTACSLCSSSFTLSGGLCYGTCPSRTYATSPNSASSTCNRCPFDCYTCDSSGNCLSCNSSVDFRQLSNNRCVPLAGYYQTGQEVAGKCPSICSSCSSLTSCSGCLSGYHLRGSRCESDCPTSNPFSSSNNASTCQDLFPKLYLGIL